MLLRAQIWAEAEAARALDDALDRTRDMHLAARPVLGLEPPPLPRHRVRNRLSGRLQHRPAVCRQNHKPDAPRRQVLLRRHVAVRRHHHIEAVVTMASKAAAAKILVIMGGPPGFYILCFLRGRRAKSKSHKAHSGKSTLISRKSEAFRRSYKVIYKCF